MVASAQQPQQFPASDYLWLSSSNSSLTDSSSKIAFMVLAMIGATETTWILSSSCSGGSGRVLVSTTLEIGASASRLIAGPESTGWVATATTSLAPRSISASAAPQIVPAVSIMSSTSTQV